MQKSQKKKTLAKKQKQPKMDKYTTVVDSSGLGDITFDVTGSVSSANDFVFDDTISIDSLSTITIPNGGYITSSANTMWTSSYPHDSSVNIDTDGITMKEGTDIVVGGRSLTKVIDKLEERLAILHPNPALEERWEQLKDLRKQYQELEKELLEKEKMWNILKKT